MSLQSSLFSAHLNHFGQVYLSHQQGRHIRDNLQLFLATALVYESYVIFNLHPTSSGVVNLSTWSLFLNIRSTRKSGTLNPYVINLMSILMKRFASPLLIIMGKIMEDTGGIFVPRRLQFRFFYGQSEQAFIRQTSWRSLTSRVIVTKRLVYFTFCLNLSVSK